MHEMAFDGQVLLPSMQVCINGEGDESYFWLRGGEADFNSPFLARRQE